MSSRHVVPLGISARVGTRSRHVNALVVRWDDILVVVDPGEGCARRAMVAGLPIAWSQAVLITHFHGDHCLGLPGVLHRRPLDGADGVLPVVHPAESSDVLDRLLAASLPPGPPPGVVGMPVDRDGEVCRIGPLLLEARRLDHLVPTFGYRLSERGRLRLDPDVLATHGLAGPTVAELVASGHAETESGGLDLADAQVPRRGQSVAIVMDTRPCDGALALAEDADVLVCESTFLSQDRDLARRTGHMTADEAGRLAAAAGARRLVLTHVSARYDDLEPLLAEARRHHDDVVMASELTAVPFPSIRQRHDAADRVRSAGLG